jgi:hypothetical protein
LVGVLKMTPPLKARMLMEFVFIIGDENKWMCDEGVRKCFLAPL